MSKNRIISQMFDVKPVDSTGDLDWEKIQSIGHLPEEQEAPVEKQPRFEENISPQLQSFNEGVNAYILGVAVENDKAPIFHSPDFNLGEFSDLNRRASEIMQLRDEQRAADSNAEKERQQHAQAEDLRIRSAGQQPEYEAAMKAEQEKINQEYMQWISRERQSEILSRKNERAGKNESAQESAASREYEIDSNEFDFSWRDIFFPPYFSFQFDMRKSLTAFASVALVVSLGVGGVSYASRGISLKGKVLGVSQEGFANLSAAIDNMAHQNFESSSVQFFQAYADFSVASSQLESMGGTLLDATRFVPFASKISSGKNAIEAGKHFAAAGQSLNGVAMIAAELKSPIDPANQASVSLLDTFELAEKNITDAKAELDTAQQNVDKVSIDDLPQDKQNQFLSLKQKLPEIRSALDLFLSNSHIFVDLLGGNGPRKYLFLFQNNSEMRATGGFIGSYGLLDIMNGHVQKFFIDGIFNPDGQLKDKIVPPEPIQKISAAWSLHDSNWFPDFPTSAQKAIQFYEKTGGPTADGVISFTPTLMQKLLEITGPIDMPEYGVTLDAKNFIEMTQYKVEVDYDKEDNQPKKILADLAPLVLDKLLSSKDLASVSKTVTAFMSGLQEKHILLYSQDSELEKIISQQGWSGEVLQTPKDYLSVINTNINGFKTDAVIDESINHQSDVQPDGSIINTMTVTRKHTGGNTQYDWLNKVNADYMRVYVPQGAKLLSVSGQTRETDKPPLDYDALGFKRDSDVQNEESAATIDPESGTRIYDEAGKTVFANWTYVSPQETMAITYKYLLPFSLFKVSVGESQQTDSYSLVVQKQSGSVGSSFVSHISYPASYTVKWNFPDAAEKNVNSLKSETTLATDRFEAVIFEKNR